MKRTVSLLLAAALILSLAACSQGSSSAPATSGTAQTTAPAETTSREETTPAATDAPSTEAPATEEAVTTTGAQPGSNVLVLYFDYSENIDTTGMDVDAVSQASIAEEERFRDRGNLLVMIDLLQERTGAEVYSLRITEPYAPNYIDMVDGARQDKYDGRAFSFADEIPDLNQVDTIYFFSPVWWYDMPEK